MTAPTKPATSDPSRPAPCGRLFRKYLISFSAVVSAALIVNGVINAWSSYQEQKRLLIGIQREQADSAAAKISQFIGEIERQLGWLSQLPAGAVPRDDMRIDAIRLLRLTPAIAEVAKLDPRGREQLRVSRRALDVIGSQADLSATRAFREARTAGVYYGPVYFFNETEPYMTLAVAGPGKNPEVTVAEVNLRFVWDLVTQIKVGKSGRVFVVDPKGRLVAHPELWLVLQNTDMSRLPHVAAALSSSASISQGDVVEDLARHTVLSVNASVAPLRWRVFVELPLDEAYASIYASLTSTAILLAILLACAFLAALLLSRRMAVPIQALTQGAARIGGGDLEQRLAIKTGDELEELGEQFNQMAAQLHESYVTLEGKVVERTTELAQARDQAWAEHAEAKRAREAAEQANETKSRFLAVVSHELRTPLNGVMGVLQLLDDGRLSAAQRRHLETAASSGETLLALIDAILEYARLEAGTETLERRNFHLDQLIEAAADLMRPQAEAKKLSLAVTLDASVTAQVNGDPVRLNRVLLNLLSNAVKFTECGRIDMEAVLEGLNSSAMLLRLSVTDTGIGVAPEMQERIFEDFVQADDSIVRRFGGSGLGLAISRRLARLMGGDLTVESVPGAGSTFQFSIPLSRAGVTALATEAGGPAHSLDVLLADDDPVNREIGAALLRKLGHRPVLASDGPAAIELVQGGTFDAVLMDLHMPGMDGIETAALIRSLIKGPKPRIIMLTADMSERSRARIAAGGITNVVSKPVLLAALRAALAHPSDDQPPAPPTPMAATRPDTLVDDEYFTDQQILLGHSRLRGLRRLFADTSARLVRAILLAAQKGDRASVKQSVHQLGSAASALGLARLFARCTGVETDAASMSDDALAAAGGELAELRDSSLAALNEHLGEHENV